MFSRGSPFVVDHIFACLCGLLCSEQVLAFCLYPLYPLVLWSASIKPIYPIKMDVNAIEHSGTLFTRELIVYALVTMENLLKTIIGSNFQGTLVIFDREEIDLEAFWNLNSLYLKEIGKHSFE